MRVVFAGTPPFAASALRALASARHDIPLVLTQPDRPAGRGMKLTPSAVAEEARKLGLPVAKPDSLKSADVQGLIAAARPDVMVVAAYGLILPKSVLAIPIRGCLNIHASLLPRWRGAAPIQRAILAGDSRTGVGIMVMEPGLDTGPVLLEMSLDIEPSDSAHSLTNRLGALGAIAIVEALARLDSLTPVPQDNGLATYAGKLSRAESALDWNRSALEIDRQVRAFDPFPGVETGFGPDSLKIWAVEPRPQPSGEPGFVVAMEGGYPIVSCGSGAVVLRKVQKPGARRIAGDEFARGHGVAIGTRFGRDPS